MWICKVYWQQAEEEDVQEFSDLTQDELDMILAEDDVELIDSETDDIGLMSGSIAITRDASQVVIEPVAPEEFLIEQQAKSMMDAKFCAHQTGRLCPSCATWVSLKTRSTRLVTTSMSTWTPIQKSWRKARRYNIFERLDAQGYQDQVRDVWSSKPT